MYTEHTVNITLKIDAHGPTEFVRERVQALLDNGTIRDAFDSAELPIVSARVDNLQETGP